MFNLAQCSPGRQVWLVCINTLDTIMLLSIIPCIYHFTNSWRHTVNTNKTKIATALFYVGLCFMTVTFILLSLNLLAGIVKCSTRHQAHYYALEAPITQCYGLQFYLLLLLVFLRLLHIFHATAYQIPPYLTRILFATYILLPFFIVAAAAMYIYEIAGGVVMAVIAFIVILALMVTLVTAYIRKLLAVYESANRLTADAQDLVAVITKTTILTLLSILVSFATPVMILLTPLLSPLMDYSPVLSSVMLLDVYTNFLCLTLSYQCFDGVYMRLCGCAQRKCEQMWSECVQRSRATSSVHVQAASVEE